MSNTIEIPADLVRESVLIGAEAASLCEKVAAEQGVLETKAPLVADVLIERGLVDPLDKEATIGYLRDSSATLDIVIRLAKQASQPSRMGAPVKSGSADGGEYNPQFPPARESDRIFEDTLNAVGG